MQISCHVNTPEIQDDCINVVLQIVIKTKKGVDIDKKIGRVPSHVT